MLAPSPGGWRPLLREILDPPLIGVPGGGGEYGSAPLGPTSFIFMQCSVKTLPNNRFSPQTQGLMSPSVTLHFFRANQQKAKMKFYL